MEQVSNWGHTRKACAHTTISQQTNPNTTIKPRFVINSERVAADIFSMWTDRMETMRRADTVRKIIAGDARELQLCCPRQQAYSSSFVHHNNFEGRTR